MIAAHARWIVAGLTIAACHPEGGARVADREADDSQAACHPPGTAVPGTALRGNLTEPDPRMATTLTRKGFALDTAGIARALDAAADPTAQLAALTAASAQQCHALVPRIEVLLAAPPPTAVEAGATLAELGSAAERDRGLARLRQAMLDPSWPEVQITAATYLARSGDDASVPAIRAGLRSTNEAVRLQAVVSISAFAGFDGRSLDNQPFTRLAELTIVLADPATSWLVRREAVYQVGRLPASSDRSALLARVAAEDPDERVRRAAALRTGQP